MLMHTTPKQLVSLVAFRLGGQPRISHHGVPHFLKELGGVTYSVCYFAKRGIWRVFWPYPARKQSRVDFLDEHDLSLFFEGKLDA